MSILDDLNNIKEVQDLDIKKEIYEAIIDDLRPYLQELLNENFRLKDDLNAIKCQYDILLSRFDALQDELRGIEGIVEMVESKCYNLELSINKIQ